MREKRLTRNYFLGTFPCDQLPLNIMKYPATLIANNDESSRAGSHWVAMFIESPRSLFYFDSLGKEPNRCIKKYLKRFSRVKRNAGELQSKDSNICGQYCIYFLHKMCIKENGSKEFMFEKIISDLCKFDDPDLLIRKFFKSYVNNK
jgi:hypothetical protein